jgi:hypothetical protein
LKQTKRQTTALLVDFLTGRHANFQSFRLSTLCPQVSAVFLAHARYANNSHPHLSAKVPQDPAEASIEIMSSNVYRVLLN